MNIRKSLESMAYRRLLAATRRGMSSVLQRCVACLGENMAGKIKSVDGAAVAVCWYSWPSRLLQPGSYNVILYKLIYVSVYYRRVGLYGSLNLQNISLAAAKRPEVEMW